MSQFPLSYYLSLPTSEYQNSPNFIAFLQALMTPFNDCATLAANMYTYFDINNAVGVQLDLIGALIGRKRPTGINPTGAIWDAQPDVDSIPDVDLLTQPINNIVNDSDYRVLLQATIIRNTWDGTIPSLYKAWSTLFPGGQIILIDNQDMTMDVVIIGNFSPTIIDLIVGDYIVPRPAGVQINYIIGPLPVFGYGLENSYISGYGVGKWLNTVG